MSTSDTVDETDTVLMMIAETIATLVLDTGASTTVAGKTWINDFMETLTKEQKAAVVREKDNRIFRFGNGQRYPSHYRILIPIQLGSLSTNLKVSVVNANVPLLLGNPDMKKLGLKVNFEKDKAHARITD